MSPGKLKKAHIFIASWNGNVAVIPLCCHYSLDAVGYKIPRLQAIAHSSGSHRDSIANANGVESESNHTSLAYALADGLGKTEKMHVAGVTLVPHGRDPHLGFVHVVIGEANPVKDGLRAALGLGLRNPGAEVVELAWNGRNLWFRRRGAFDYLLALVGRRR